MNVLLDASLPPRVARALHQLASPSHHIEHVRDVLGNDATDQHIADYLRDRADTVIIGIDLENSSNPHRIQALLTWSVPVMQLHEDWLTLSMWDQAWQLAAQLPSIIKKVAKDGGAAVYLVPPHHAGRIRKIT